MYDPGLALSLKVTGVSEQVRILYDASNYYSTTVGSTGIVTFNAVGSGSGFTFSDPITNTNAALTTPTITTSITLSVANIITDTSTGTKICTATNQKLGFFNAAPVVQQTDGATLTNNVTSGGTTNQIDDFTSLTIYATDAAAIRNNIYQLARKVKILTDALRTLGLTS